MLDGLMSVLDGLADVVFSFLMSILYALFGN